MQIMFGGFRSKFSKAVNIAIINGYALNEKYYFANNRILELNADIYEFNDTKTELILSKPISLKLKDGIVRYQVV